MERLKRKKYIVNGGFIEIWTNKQTYMKGDGEIELNL